MSAHSIEIVKVGEVRDHPNADRLSITEVDGWSVVVGKGDFEKGQLAVYIPPDFTVPVDRDYFKFLEGVAKNGRARIKVRKIRDEWSEGLLIPLPDELLGYNLDNDVSEQLGIERYEPPTTVTNAGEMGDKWGPPAKNPIPVFDVENFQKYPRLFNEGEEVVVTEKLHGTNARFVNIDGTVYVGSRKNWWKPDPANLYWRGYESCLALRNLLAVVKDTVFYGEIFGQVQRGFDYGIEAGKVDVRLFAAYSLQEEDTVHWDETRWYDDHAIRSLSEEWPCWVPVLYRGEFRRDRILAMAEGQTTLGEGHIREGIVVVPVRERRVRMLPNQRLALKVVSKAYLEKD